MTDIRSTGPQIEAPNPLELFWERNSGLVKMAAALLVVGLGVNYLVQYLGKQRVNREWSVFATTTGLDKGYASDGSGASQLDAFLNNPEFLQYYYAAAQGYVRRTREELVTEIQQDIRAVDAGQLATELDAAKGTPMEPLLIWVSAIRSAQRQDWSASTSHLDTLERQFSNHFLCQSSDYPPQFRAEIPSEEGDEKAKPKPGEEPDLVEPMAGSLVSELRDQIQREQKFRVAHARLYEAIAPDPTPVVVMKLNPLDEEVRIRFYRERAPEHVDNFLRLVQKGWYQGQRIDQVERKGTQAASEAAMQFHFGLLTTRDEDDRTKWAEARRKDSEIRLEYEDNDLSHFPGAVAAAPEGDGQSSGERVWICANDAARFFDGERVVFGQVDEQDLAKLRRICEMDFADEETERTGRGQLNTAVTLTFHVEGEPVPEPWVVEPK